MKKLTLPLLLTLLVSGAQAQLVQVVNEYYGTKSTGEEVYRIFAELQDPDDFVSAVWAAANNSLYLGSDIGGISNDAFGTTTGDNLSTAFCAFITDLCFDSYVTLGHAGSPSAGQTVYYDDVTLIECGQPVSAISVLPSGNVFELSFGNAAGENLVVEDGVWFATNTPGCNDQGLPFGPSNRVFLAQVALPVGSSLIYGLNLQIFDADGTEYMYVWNPADLDGDELDGSNLGCVWPNGNCVDESACNYNQYPEEEANNAVCDYSCYGCTDTVACNYDPVATIDDGSCGYEFGCTDDAASNYDSTAICDDGTCEYSGCTDESACNYNPDASVDDGSCILPDGCTDSNATNYDSTALCDDGSCVVPGCTNITACNFNPEATEDDGSCELPNGCTDAGATNYDPEATCDDGSCQYPTNSFLTIEPAVVHDGFVGETDLTGYTTYHLYVHTPNEDDFVSSVYGLTGEETLISTTTTFWQTPFGGVSVENINPLFFDVIPEVQYDSFVTVGKLTNADEGTAIIVSEDPIQPWTPGFEAGGAIDIGGIIGGSWYTLNTPETVNGIAGPDNKVLVAQLTTDGQIDACISVQIFPNGEGLDGYLETICATSGPVEGCTDSSYCNYNPLAEVDDGSCSDTCEGCTDSVANNYDANANLDDGSCLYFGCTNPDSDNYDSTANFDDGSCEISGCTDALAFNFDELANVDDGSCDYDCEGNTFFIDMQDSFGDGWDAGQWNLFDDLGNVVDSGSLDTAPAGDGGSTGSDLLCLDDGCYTFEVGGSAFDSEITWTVEYDGNIVSGGAPETIYININGDCIYGCLDPNACNYDSTANTNVGCDYSCVGCTDSTACNYEPEFTIDDGGCLYEAVISGTVFYDTNQDGFFDPTGSEAGLGGWQVELEELSITTFTDDDGNYEFFNVPAGSYTLIATAENEWANSTATTIEVTTMTCMTSDQHFGFYPEGAGPFIVFGLNSIWNPNLHCENGMNIGVFIQNLGSEALNGQLTVTFDASLEADQTINLPGIATPDEFNPGEVIWYLDSIPPPGVGMQFLSAILGPGVDAMGETYDITTNISLVDSEGSEYYNNTTVQTVEVVCAYDPNDKYAAYEGYTENHFVLKEDAIEYRIRFQNEGNYYAEDVVIRDTLDLALLDVETFDPLYGSHSFMTCINENNGAVEFIFEDIMLPAEEDDEEGSKGYVVFSIKPRADVSVGDEINNTAYIFFDGNPPIVTNTTWHTIYECGNEADFTLSEEDLCEGSEITAASTWPYIDELSWTLNGEEVLADEVWSQSPETEGTYLVEFTASNELCAPISNSQSFDVHPYPEATITVDGITLTASEGDSWQWYVDGEPISGADDQILEITEYGSYTVEVINEWGCSTVSEPSAITSVEMNEALGIQIYPNPMIDQTTVYLGSIAGDVDVVIIDARGRQIWRQNNIADNSIILDKGSISAGVYTVKLIAGELYREVQLIVQ